MPKLDFKGKSKVYAYHLTLPQRHLQIVDQLSVPPAGQPPSLSDNVLIRGDNLHVLKALLPHYAGQVKCIIIDPPYNTGNESWRYNDNVSAPFMQKWLQQEVGRDDLERHDKWLCMMWPRLVLLRELLAEDGLIFVNIDDHEQAHLQLIMNEIFGADQLLASLVVQLNPRGRSLDKHFAKTHEYILVYAKNAEQCTVYPVPKDAKSLATYKNEDEEGGAYRLLELRNTNPAFHRGNRPKLFFPIWVNPQTGSCAAVADEQHSLAVYPQTAKHADDCWTWSVSKVAAESHRLVAKWVKTGRWRIYRKDYRAASETAKPKSIWLDKNINNAVGRATLKRIFSEDPHPFDYPKSPELIKKILAIATTAGDLVLDSFAGSGTTAQAVLELNQADGGGRKFILVECEEYASTLTAERLRRLIQGAQGGAEGESDQPRLSGSFSFATLGDELSPASLLFGGSLPSYAQLAQYVYFTATGVCLDTPEPGEDYFIGTLPRDRHVALFLIYQPDRSFLTSTQSALHLHRTAQIVRYMQVHAYTRAVVFATACYCLDELATEGIQFCSLPLGIHRLAGG